MTGKPEIDSGVRCYILEYDRDKYTGESVIAVLEYERVGGSVRKNCLHTHFDQDAEWLFNILTKGREITYNRYGGCEMILGWDPNDGPLMKLFTFVKTKRKGKKADVTKTFLHDIRGEEAIDIYKKLTKEIKIDEAVYSKTFDFPRWTHRTVIEDSLT